jgi:hypothetical protein
VYFAAWLVRGAARVWGGVFTDDELFEPGGCHSVLCFEISLGGLKVN